jgi:hypothetical protein
MQATNTARLTDALERDLLAKAMDQQFRFRPLRSVAKLVSSTAAFIARARSQTNMRDMV